MAMLRERRTDVVVIGAGHAGLAMSRTLADRGIEHVVLERGEPGHAWRHERWDSLRLLTPNWMCRLPGQAYDGCDPDGFMAAPEVAGLLARYAERSGAPLRTHTTVLRVVPVADGHRVVTDAGDWLARAVVIASGACNLAQVPPLAAEVPPGIAQCTTRDYRRASDLDPGGVLVVGASASGLQLAQELCASGRRVWLAAGEHVRMPRRYRGRDVQWWLLASGILDQRIEAMDDAVRARHLPSPQLVGSADHATLDLNAVQRQGVELCGRLVGLRGSRAQFSGSLRNVCALADLKMNRMLEAFDAWATQQGMADRVGAVERFAPTAIEDSPRLDLELGGQVRTILWATGYRPDHRWLEAPVFDRRGALRHDRGVVDAPGLYVLGLPFLRRRKSSFIHGAADDASEITAHLVADLEHRAKVAMHNSLTVGAPPWPAIGGELAPSPT